MKRVMQHKRLLSLLIVVLMAISATTRLYITHDRGYYEDYLRTAHPSCDCNAWVSCNCPICHAEDFLSTEAENFEYNPIVVELDFERAFQPTATANQVPTASSLRAPPYLS